MFSGLSDTTRRWLMVPFGSLCSSMACYAVLLSLRLFGIHFEGNRPALLTTTFIISPFVYVFFGSMMAPNKEKGSYFLFVIQMIFSAWFLINALASDNSPDAIYAIYGIASGIAGCSLIRYLSSSQEEKQITQSKSEVTHSFLRKVHGLPGNDIESSK